MMEIKKEKLLMYALPLVVLLAFLLLSPGFGLRSVNRAFALSAVVVLGITFIIGPLSKFIKAVNRGKLYRRYLGLAGVAIFMVHIAISFVFYYSSDIFALLDFGNPRMLQVYAGLIALIIFFLMVITSAKQIIRVLGGKNWKLIQNTGYIAMILVMLHFMLANTSRGDFNIDRIYALAAFAFGIIIILARIFVLILVQIEKSSRKK